MGYVVAALGLIAAAQSVALFVLLRARRGTCRRGEAGTVAHDLNNSLAVILNYASFVHDDLPEDDPRRNDVAEIRRAARLAGGLGHELLEMTRGDRAPARVARARNAPGRLRQAPRKRRAAA